MIKEEIIFHSIGIIHSPHQKLSDIPIQPVFCNDIKGTVVVNPEFADGLIDLHEFSHIYLFYYFHQSQRTCLHVKPYLSDEEHGVFSTRAPHRPNKLGMSLVQLIGIEDNVLYVTGIDILDGTPLIDIKPYIQRYNSRKNARSGWQEAVSEETASIQGMRNYKKQE
jgi:tRNA-Thr(GGU) m(6)t(6)A37 methyltransferase TsaA